MTRLERPSLTALGLAAGLAVSTAALPAHADGAAVQVFPQAAAPYAGTDPGLAFPGARPPQSRLLVPASPGSLTPPARPTSPAPPRAAAPKPQKPAPATKPAPVVAQPKTPPKPTAAPVAVAAPAQAAPVVAVPAPVAVPEPAPAPPPPAPAPAALGPDQAPQEDLVAREPTPAAPAAEPPAPATVAPAEPPAAPAVTPAVVTAAPAAQPVTPAAAPEALTIAFVPATADPAADNAPDVARLAAALSADPGARVRLNAYAPGGPEEESSSRRLSLSRALAVRAKLVDAGVASTRIEVRALGNRVPDGPADRVDVIVLER
ncbi:Outer membrane protein OmpA [Caenispirillum bisanense]|uniref:Outer membrane protein OmpA n=2 Tax=Caenispirillum bisanense TaxID=414052 RepID=A0A286GQA0_9PROT|nr:Outer membrane protein OmpA [Caenispirillum bisanense]